MVVQFLFDRILHSMKSFINECNSIYALLCTTLTEVVSLATVAPLDQSMFNRCVTHVSYGRWSEGAFCICRQFTGREISSTLWKIPFRTIRGNINRTVIAKSVWVEKQINGVVFLKTFVYFERIIMAHFD